ncbi:unnamed protein product [Owenia fusiformis]|uniref:Uncharacterized protein n=1 Tax=Owenia fusiformis TaxID=6347 RepID=A0A8J1XU96_OWEFU|nr:unnamed protein product [Owenia fusiformis]
MTVSKTDTETMTGYRSKFLHRLSKLPAVQLTKSFYETTKTVEVLKCGLEFAEKRMEALSQPVKAAIPIEHEFVQKLDLAANGTLKTLERQFPIVTEYPVQASERIGRKALRSFPGRQFLKGLDLIIGVSETALDFVKPMEECRVPSESPIEPDTKPSVDETDKPSSTDEGVDVDTESVNQMASKNNQREPKQPLLALATEGFDVAALTKTLYCFTVVWSLDMWVQTLKSVRRYLRRLYTGQYRKSARIKTSKLSPSRAQAMEARRIKKVAPHKPAKESSKIEQLGTWVLALFGKTPEKQSSGDIRKYLINLNNEAVGETPDDGDHERKRKFSDVSSDSSDVSDIDLATFDLDNYISDDDPDYEPCSETESDESLEFVASASEDELLAELQEDPTGGQDEVLPKMSKQEPPEVAPKPTSKPSNDDALPGESPNRKCKDDKSNKDNINVVEKDTT